MQRISYVNGQYYSHMHAMVHMEDRGYQFADGIYEVIAITGGKLVDEEQHLDRLERSLNELAIRMPMKREALRLVMHEVIRRNRCKEGSLYMQVTRGAAKRAHDFPGIHVKPSLVITTTGPKFPSAAVIQQGVAVITYPDIRWGRRDIKSVALLPNILAKEAAKQAGVKEAWLYTPSSDLVTEGSSSNTYIVTDQNVVVTHPLGNEILGGVTRAVVLRLAQEAGIKIEERPFSRDEAYRAKEAFFTSTTSCVLPVMKIDDRVIGNGHQGEITGKLAALYEQHLDSYRK